MSRSTVPRVRIVWSNRTDFEMVPIDKPAPAWWDAACDAAFKAFHDTRDSLSAPPPGAAPTHTETKR